MLLSCVDSGVNLIQYDDVGRADSLLRMRYVILLGYAKYPRHCAALFTQPSVPDRAERLSRAYTPSVLTMKRQADASKEKSAAKRREPEPAYCDTAPRIDEKGSAIWPAPAESIKDARQFLRQWYAFIYILSIFPWAC